MASRKQTAVARDAWIVFEDEAGYKLRPPIVRTWSPRGTTPQVATPIGGQGRLSVAALCAYRRGHTPRLLFRTRDHTANRRSTRRSSFDWSDYRDLLRAAHRVPGAPIVLVWDNLNVQSSAAIRAFIDGTDWLTVVYLPSYAPDLNPVEGVWSVVKRGEYANQAFTGIDQMARVVRASPRRVQNRPQVLEGVLAHTGLALTKTTDNTN